jgi:hypothetical protein
MVQSSMGKQFMRPYLEKKKKNINRTGRVAQVLEQLPSKCEVLGSNSSTAKKKKVAVSAFILSEICH